MLIGKCTMELSSQVLLIEKDNDIQWKSTFKSMYIRSSCIDIIIWNVKPIRSLISYSSEHERAKLMMRSLPFSHSSGVNQLDVMADNDVFNNQNTRERTQTIAQRR
eukprot:1026051_1